MDFSVIFFPFRPLWCADGGELAIQSAAAMGRWWDEGLGMNFKIREEEGRKVLRGSSTTYVATRGFCVTPRASRPITARIP